MTIDESTTMQLRTETAPSSERLRESEARSRILAELSADYAYVGKFGEQGQLIIEWATDAALVDLTGYSVQELQDLGGWEALVLPRDRVTVRAHFQTLRCGYADTSEFCVVARNGEVRFLREASRPEWDETDKTALRIYSAGQDISRYRQAATSHDATPGDGVAELKLINEALEQQIEQCKHAEAALRESEERYRQIVEAAGDMVYTANADGWFSYVNPPAQTLTGYSVAELLQMRLYDLLSPDWQAVARAFHTAQMRERKPKAALELPILTKDGAARWVEQTVTLAFEGEQIMGFQGIVRDVTRRRLTEDELVNSDMTNRALLHAIPDLILRVNREGRLLDFKAPKGHGLRVDQMLMPDISDLFPPTVISEFLAQVSAALESGDIQLWEYHTLREGETRYFEVRIVKYGDEEALTLVRDITERKCAETELRATTLRLATLLESLQDGILVENELRQIALVNQEFCTLWAIPTPPQALIGTDCSRTTEDSKSLFADPEQFVTRIGEILRNRVVMTGEELLMADGRILERNYMPIFFGEDYRGHLWQYRDITGRRQFEEALRESEERLRRITDNMLDMILQVDTQGIIQYASPSTWSVLGHLPDRLIGKSVYTWLHPDDFDRVVGSFQTMDRIEYRYQHAEGHYIWVETISSLLFDSDAVSGFIFASRDITERKQVEQQLKELGQLKSEFLSTAAHELRTPLTSIRGFSEILLTRKLDESRQRRYLTLINEQSRDLGAIIDDLLDVSRLEAGRGLKISPEPMDLIELIRDVAVPFIESAPKHHIDLALPEQCPQIQGDPFRLAQVMKNLLSNAIKYSPEGSTVQVRCRILPSFLEVAVQDEGIGMTPDQQAHLFEKFYRASASNNAVGGTGLGLAISKLIVELHRGKIWARSEHGVGSIFYFTLPLPAKQA